MERKWHRMKIFNLNKKNNRKLIKKEGKKFNLKIRIAKFAMWNEEKCESF